MTVIQILNPSVRQLAAILLPAWIALGALAGNALAAEAHSARELFNRGQYADCIAACLKSIALEKTDESAWTLEIRAEVATGHYTAALEVYQVAMERFNR